MIRMSITESGLKQAQLTLDRYASRVKTGIARATGQLAHALRKEIVTGIRNQAPGGIRFVPLRPATIARKGSSKALIDHGDLIRSVNVTKLGDLAYFVGINKNVVAPNGKPMVNIAEIHEYGAPRAHIPARPYLRPSYAIWAYHAEEDWCRLVAKEIGVPSFVAKKMTAGALSHGEAG